MEYMSFNFTLPDSSVIDLNAYLMPLKIKPDDIVIASGTLVEGIGNEYSDIDVYIITDKIRNSSDIDITNFFRAISPGKEIIQKGEHKDILLVHLPVEKTGVKVDVEFKTYDDINSIAEQFKENYGYAVNNHILLTKEMPERQMSFMHRIHNCICLHNNDALKEIKSKFPVSVLNYFLYRLNASDFADFLDITGAWRKDEIERCVDLARENLIKQMLAYTCLMGNTDYKRKWLLTRMQQVGVDERLSKQFLTLFLRNKLMTDKNYIIETLRMVDEIFFASAQFFNNTTDPLIPNSQVVLSWLEQERKKCVKEYEFAEVDYRCKAYNLESQWSTEKYLDKSLI